MNRKTRLRCLFALVTAFVGAACKKEQPLPPLAPAQAKTKESTTTPDAATKPTTVTAAAAAAFKEGEPRGEGAPADGGLELLPPTGSRALARYLASPEHQKVARVAREMRAQMKAGKCVEAIDRAKELADAIRAAGGELRPNLDVRAMARAIQNDPDFMDKAYMSYKSTLVGLAIGIEFAPMTVKLSASNPEAQKQACERFSKFLEDIRQPD